MTTRKPLACLAALFIAGLAPAAMAADYADPTWPCIQRKVENLSAGLMWPTPIPQSRPEDESTRRAVTTLAETLAIRRLTLEELEPEVAAFAEAHAGDADLMGLVFDGVFHSLATRRSRIMEGIGDFSLSQIALSEKIEGARVEMDAEMAKEDPDFDKVDTLEEQLDWDQTIYTDRQQSIQYLCETPVLLEKRLYAIAQMLQAHTE
ncbi:hypothetical protein [Sagittula salina]|uniref:Chorismate mutase n=1 Tax=Sagittula salina TaxID=2820268 RepID=A0A940MTE0_9RHOB|nr:hypothetical protein [Sagittula salina]MBP0484702.1 hypothetical protein [Sagittula salina]